MRAIVMDFWTDEAFAEISFLKNLLSPLRMDQGTRGPPHELGLRQFSSPSEKMLAAVLLVPLGLSPLTMSRHEYFISEMATATTPPALGAAAALLEARGEHILDPLPEASMHPLVIPLTRSASTGAVTGLLRWPGADGALGRELPLVRTCSDADKAHQLTWLAPNPAQWVRRENELAAAAAEDGSEEAVEEAAALAALASAVGLAPASSGKQTGKGPAARVILKVGPFMGEYETLAHGHLEAGSTEAALITCERNSGLFPAWGRPLAFHSRVLAQMGRDEEARDVARQALALPLWTLGDSVAEICEIAQQTTDELFETLTLKANGKLTAAELRQQNGMEKRTPQVMSHLSPPLKSPLIVFAAATFVRPRLMRHSQLFSVPHRSSSAQLYEQEIAKESASYTMDLVVARPEEKEWSHVRSLVADLYQAAEMDAVAALITNVKQEEGDK